jgi:hypothetical protein
MLYISISSLILVFFIFFLKALAYINNSIIIVKERDIKVNTYELYETNKLKLVIIIITPSIIFIFKRIYIGLAISIVLLDI